MSTIKTEVVVINDVRPHPNADALELATVKGWQMVVRKGAHTTGERVVYFEAGTVLPPAVAERFGVTGYLSNKLDINGNRVLVVHRVKLRGEPSFGLAVAPDEDWPVGTDVSAYYGTSKFQPPVKTSAGDAELDHPLFPAYTDIENMRSYPDVFEAGEGVVATEKIHGCLRATTRVRMADGTLRFIQDVQVGDEVLGVDDQGRVVATSVTNTFVNGRGDSWLRLTGRRAGLGRGNSEWVIVATPNHRFFTPDRGYVAAEHLRPNDSVVMVRSEVGLTPIQEQILIGKMLGDGSLQRRSGGSGAVSFGHANKAYTDWTARGLGSVVTDTEGRATSGYGSEMSRRVTVWRWDIANLFAGWYERDGSKHLPADLPDRITPLALAFWYMDDGSLAHHEDQEDRALIATCSFDEHDHTVLVQMLRRYGIEAVVYESSGKLRLRLNENAAERLFLLIAPYVPPAMQYKLPERYRGSPGWLPDPGNGEYKPLLKEQVLESIEPYHMGPKENTWRYDIETETHNFFASDVLVHNSNCRVGFVVENGELVNMAGSRTLRRKQPNSDLRSSTYWFPWSLPAIVALLTELHEAGHTQAVLYGEVYGKGVQSYDYGESSVGFRAFDLMVDGTYVDYASFVLLCDRAGVQRVPLVYEGPFSLEAIKAVSDGDSLVGGTHGREGVVVRPSTERQHPQLGRVVLKYIGDAYLFSKKGGGADDTTDQ